MGTDLQLLNVNGIEIYTSDIEMLTEEYLSTLPDENMIYSKSAIFNGLLDLIYKRLLKNVIVRDSGITNTAYNYSVLNDIFHNIYLPLCYRFNSVPTILQFSVLCNISNTALTDIRKGYYRGKQGSKVNPTSQQIVQKWYEICESGLYSKAIQESSIGAIFALKAVHGMSDTQTIRIESNEIDSHETAAEIMARHDSAMIPEKPDLTAE